MRKTTLSALIAGAFACAGTAHAGLTFDLDGVGGAAPIVAQSLDWAPTSFLAQGGNAAIVNFATSGGACANNSCQFDVLTHAKLTGYAPLGGNFIGLPANALGEITMVARYTERVTGFNPNGNGPGLPSANFANVAGSGWVEFYWSPLADSNNLTGSGFNNGTLIGRMLGVNISSGNFAVSDATPLDIDGSGANDYANQKTVTGNGSQGSIRFGSGGVQLDNNFFLTQIADFSINFQNVSIGLPYQTVDPSDCFNPTAQAGAVGSAAVSTCGTAADHVNGLYSANAADSGGYLPVVGAVNGLADGRNQDFVAQTDFNSSVAGTVPEPTSLALMGLALASMAAAAKRRRRS